MAMDKRFIEQLVWNRDPFDERSYVVDCKITGDRFRMVWQDPCWCLRLESPPSTGVSGMTWMGQFPEPGGLRTAKAKAQKFHDQRLRVLAWAAFQKENDPPWPDIGKV